MISKAQKKAISKYDDKNAKQIKLNLNVTVNLDKDILDKLEKVPNRKYYIKKLIRSETEKIN